VGECFFWYRPTRVVPDKRPLNGCCCNVRKQAINGKLQGSVATYLRCGGVVNNQIMKGLLLSLSVKNKC